MSYPLDSVKASPLGYLLTHDYKSLLNDALNEGMGSIVAWNESKRNAEMGSGPSSSSDETALERLSRQVCAVRGLEFQDVLGDLCGME